MYANDHDCTRACSAHRHSLRPFCPLESRIRSDKQDTLFGRTITPAERLRQHQRSLQKAQRELEREKGKLEAQEKKTMADIKKNAKAGNMVGPLI